MLGALHCLYLYILCGGSILHVLGGPHCVGGPYCVWGPYCVYRGSALLPTACGFVQNNYFEFLAKKKMLKILEDFCCSSQPLPFLSQPQNTVRSINTQ